MQFLVVDDDFYMRELIHDLLAIDGHQSIIVETISEALQVVQSEHIDAVLTDINLSEGNGYELTQAIRGFTDDTRIAQLPVIGMTANPDESVMEQGVTVGITHIMSKPFETGKFYQLIAGQGQHMMLNHQEIADNNDVYNDFSKMDALSEVLNKEKIHNLVKLFLDDLQQGISDLSKYVLNKEWVRVKDLAHRLSGSCAGYGLYTLQFTFRHLEDSAKEEKWQTCTDLNAIAISQFEVSQKEMHQHFDL